MIHQWKRIVLHTQLCCLALLYLLSTGRTSFTWNNSSSHFYIKALHSYWALRKVLYKVDYHPTSISCVGNTIPHPPRYTFYLVLYLAINHLHSSVSPLHPFTPIIQDESILLTIGRFQTREREGWRRLKQGGRGGKALVRSTLEDACHCALGQYSG